MSQMIDREKYDQYQAAKSLLYNLGFALISREQYNSMQKRIIDLEEELNSFYQVTKDGLKMIHNINEAIKKNLDTYTDEGAWLPPIEVGNEMAKFTQTLQEIYDRSLPLIKD